MTIEKLSAPKDIKELTARIAEFSKEHDFTKPLSPRLFRIYIGVSKQTLSNWKNNEKKKDLFDLIKEWEDILLAVIEQETIKLSSVSNNKRVNIIGLINTLRAYDAEQYIPELRNKEQLDTQAPIQINLTNKGENTNQLAIPVEVKEKLNAK